MSQNCHTYLLFYTAQEEVKALKASMEQIEQFTCLKFHPKFSVNRDYIEFVSQDG